MERWATFDCYGTLIDWNGGIGRELERLFGAGRVGELLHAYHELEPQIQREDQTRSYRDVMAGRLRPADGGGRGLVMVHFLADLVQRHTSQTGTTTRVHVLR